MISIRITDGGWEKPEQGHAAPATLAIIGRYILTPDIFDILEETQPGKGGDPITDALPEQAKKVVWLRTSLKVSVSTVAASMATLKRQTTSLPKRLPKAAAKQKCTVNGEQKKSKIFKLWWIVVQRYFSHQLFTTLLPFPVSMLCCS